MNQTLNDKARNAGVPPVTYGEGSRPPRGDYASAQADYTGNQHWEQYTPADHDLYRRLYERQAAQLPGLACQEFIDAVAQLGSPDRIPRFEDLNERLLPATGWQIVAVPGLIPEVAFFALLSRLSPSELTITLLGATGTGKDVLARAIHARSPRAKGPFVVFDCGAVAPSLIESHLFGHEKGSFTGATERREGRFELADGGTLLLDEISEVSTRLQAKQLRVLQERVRARRRHQDDQGRCPSPRHDQPRSPQGRREG